MKIQLSPGEMVKINLEDTDGEFVVAYGISHVFVTADMPDVFGRSGVIYQEPWGNEAEPKIGKDGASIDVPSPFVGDCAVCLRHLTEAQIGARVEVTEPRGDLLIADQLVLGARLVCIACTRNISRNPDRQPV